MTNIKALTIGIGIGAFLTFVGMLFFVESGTQTQRSESQTPPASSAGPKAPTTFLGGIIGQSKSTPRTTDACAGVKRTKDLAPGEVLVVDKFNACRVPFYFEGGAVEAQDERLHWYDLRPGSARDIVAVRAKDQAVIFSYSRCPKWTSGKLNWDCTSL